jgi:hypothetical protein
MTSSPRVWSDGIITGRLLGLAAIVAAGLLVAPRWARACAECGCGDPTLTVLGSEKPLRHRLRAGASATWQGLSSGVGDDELNVTERRLDLAAAWAPLDRLFVVATLPLVRRDLAFADGQRRQIDGVGDLELRAKGFVWEDRSFSPRHLVALTGGVRLPTSPWTRDAVGAPVSPEQQIGSGAVSAIVGASYAFFRFPWSAYVSAEASAPVVHQAWYRPAPSLRTTVAGQRHVARFLAVQLGLDARIDGHAEEPAATGAVGSEAHALVDHTHFLHPGHEHDEPPGAVVSDHEHAGGTAVFATGGLLVTPLSDLVAFAQVRVPVLQRLHDGERNGPIVSLGVLYDF